VAGPVDANLIADDERGQQGQRPEPSEVHIRLPPALVPACSMALHGENASVKPARLRRLIPGAFVERVPLENR
jgi:hypothetical protein